MRPAQGASPDAVLRRFLAEQRDGLGRACAIQAVFALQELRYVACGDAGIWIVGVRKDATLALLARNDLQGFVSGFFERDGQLWAEVTQVRAHRIGPIGAGGGTTVRTAPPRTTPSRGPSPDFYREPTAEPERPEPLRSTPDGTVVEAGPGYVVVDFGRSEGIEEGHHIAFYAARRGQRDDGTLRPRLIAVGRVVDAETQRSRVQLGTGERVATGSRAMYSLQQMTASTIAPPRVGGVWEIGFMARPFIVLDELGGGILADAWLGRRFDGPFHLEARIAPFAIGSADDGTTVPFAGFVTASYDGELFEVGLGLGGETVNSPAFDLDTGSGLSVVQRVRLGAVDGLNLTAFTHIVLFHSEFEFSSLRMQAQIPLDESTWLLAGGGGGSIGVGYGEVGIRSMLAGNGDRGSFFMTVVAGGAAVFEEARCTAFEGCAGPGIEYAGPMVGVGGEWRY